MDALAISVMKVISIVLTLLFCAPLLVISHVKDSTKWMLNASETQMTQPLSSLEGETTSEEDKSLEDVNNSGVAAYKSVFIIPMHDMIDGGLFSSIERRVKIAQEAKVDMIIFDIDTFGGRLDAAIDISEYISDLEKIRTIAYISNKAISAGALVAIACNEIIMSPDAELGDCEPIIPSAEGGYKTAGEKIQTVLRAKFRKFAEKNGYPILLAEAMVTVGSGIYHIETEDNPVGFYISAKELKEMTEEEQKKIKKKKLIVEEGKLLTMHGKEAYEYGFSKHLVDNIATLLSMYGLKEDKTTELETNWSEEMVRFIEKIAPILLTIGIIGLYMEFKTPGFGLPGIIGILCFAAIFLSKYLVGLAETPEIILFFVGIALIAVEVFLFPGFGIAGIAGIIMVLVGLILSFQDFTVPHTPYDSEVLRKNLFMIVSSFLVSSFAIVLLLKYMPGIPIFSRIVLTTAETADYGFKDGAVEARSALIGKKGMALTPLHTSGRIEFGEKSLDVVTQGDFIDKGQTVEIIEVKGSRIVVKAV